MKFAFFSIPSRFPRRQCEYWSNWYQINVCIKYTTNNKYTHKQIFQLSNNKTRNNKQYKQFIVWYLKLLQNKQLQQLIQFQTIQIF